MTENIDFLSDTRGNNDMHTLIENCLKKHPNETLLDIARSRDGTQMARAYLSRAATIRNEIALKLSRLDDLKNRRIRVGTLSLAFSHGGDISDPVGDAAQKIVDLERETLESYNLLTETERHLIGTIGRVGNDVYRLILHMRYIDGVKFPVIGMRVGFGEKHVYKLHDKALTVAALILLSDAKNSFDNRAII